MTDDWSQGAATFEDALESGHGNLAAVAHVVGASAAHDGSPLQELFGYLERAYARVRGEQPEFDVVTAAAVAWTESAIRHDHDMSCEDPLTALATLPHLRCRIGGVYRRAERDGVRANETFSLLVVELPPTSGGALSEPLAMLEAADSLRTVYNGDETIAQVAPRRIVSLVERSRTDRASLELLHILLRRGGVGPLEPRMWIEALPRSVDGVGWLLSELGR
ncbi:MAG TPA: hypothetical protein VFC57_01810 [Aeromicrobium sp.]|nr:hypothetical protein [Aeromicrobium sp.]